MTHGPCPVCGCPAEMPVRSGLCLACAKIAYFWSLRAIRWRMRAARMRGVDDELHRECRRMIDRLRTLGELHLRRLE